MEKTVLGSKVSVINVLPVTVGGDPLAMKSYKLPAAVRSAPTLRYKMATGNKRLTILIFWKG